MLEGAGMDKLQLSRVLTSSYESASKAPMMGFDLARFSRDQQHLHRPNPRVASAPRTNHFTAPSRASPLSTVHRGKGFLEKYDRV